MNERRSSRRGPVTTLRVAAGSVAVLAPLVLGLIGHSPWKALLLVPAFVASYAIGRADTWRALSRDGGAVQLATTVLASAVVQLVMVGVLYAVGLGLGALFSSVLPLDPLSRTDLPFIGVVWAVTLGSALLVARLERGRSPLAPEA